MQQALHGEAGGGFKVDQLAQTIIVRVHHLMQSIHEMSYRILREADLQQIPCAYS